MGSTAAAQAASFDLHTVYQVQATAETIAPCIAKHQKQYRK